ncbi:MAG: extracellular solute-binding protein [Armatimonadota bacterium]|nr:extracellular solute-binding protein [Armatimonadota bacterium]MDR7449689.1 extracellular solute-binding protein [Armatimonadota bacterium]MDR7458395.1 extracellular solute-binding protein [Armatimonadota bacterium]MDR7478802.1 extracellular solute-binding protein [Armatimonadota bacterium]MDR7488825.1 extracellular solute-binding protein [Armatimonadota bacterium]
MRGDDAGHHGMVSRRALLKTAAATTLAASTGLWRLPWVAAQERVITLDYYTLFHSGDAAAMERIVRRFNAESRTVKLNLLQGQWAEYYAQLFAAVGAGNAPQIGICHSSRVMDVYRALTPLEESRAGNLLEVADIRASQYTRKVWEAGVYQGRRYLVPLDSHMWGLWYNKDLFRQAGLDPDRAPETREEFERACEALRTRTGRFAFHPAEDALPRKVRRAWEILFWGQGGELLTPDGRRAAFNDDRGLRALDYLVTMIRRGWNQPGTDGFKQFAAGQLGMLLAGNWYLPTAKDSGVNFGFHYVPKFFERAVTWGDSHNLVIPRQRPDRVTNEVLVAAIRTIKWINEHSDEWGIYGGHIPAYLPAQRSRALLESDSWRLALNKFADMANRGYVHYPLTHEKAPQVHAAIEPYIQEAYNLRLAPREALARAEAEVNRVLAG